MWCLLLSPLCALQPGVEEQEADPQDETRQEAQPQQGPEAVEPTVAQLAGQVCR
jgi:hypothetical protein